MNNIESGKDTMKDCCVCKRQITDERSAILFVGADGKDKEVCNVCEQKFEVIMANNNSEQVQMATQYFRNCLMTSNDEEVKNYFEMVKENSSDYGKIKEGGGSGWIFGMRIISWIAFFLTIIGGLVYGILIGDPGVGVLVFFGSIIMAFISVAMTMIFLDLAQDVSEIKNLLKRK